MDVEITPLGAVGKAKKWTTIFEHPEEWQFGYRTLRTFLPRIGSEWSVAFKFKPTIYSGPHVLGLDLPNFLQINFDAMSMKFHITRQSCAAVNGKQFVNNLPKLGEWTLVQVDQHRVAANRFLFEISIGGIQIHSEILQHCQDCANVRVYSQEAMLGSAGSIKDMEIITNL